jgi:hypothetical protein
MRPNRKNSYNWRLLLRTAGKSALVVAGFSYGLSRGLRALGRSSITDSQFTTLASKVETMQLAVARLGEQYERFESRLAEAVTHDALKEALERAFGELRSSVDARFEQEARSVEALRMMIGQTDAMLERVLNGLDTLQTNRQN